MRFQVPQFIEIEDKIFGPLTFKQFIYLAGAAGISVVFLMTLPLVLAILAAAPFVALGLALAFYKINERPFINVLESAFNYVFSKKLYLWNKEAADARGAKKEKSAPAEEKQQGVVVPKVSSSKLKDLAWSLDVKERIHK